MYQILNLTADAAQTQNLTLPDGSVMTFTMTYIPMQYGWFFTSITVNTFTLNNLRITNSPNILYQFKNILTFGISCFSVSNREPSQQEDFLSGASNLYILTSNEVAEYAEFLGNG